MSSDSPDASATTPAQGTTTSLSAPAVTVPTSSLSATATATDWTKAQALSHAKSITAGPDAALKALAGASATSTLAQARTAITALATADSAAISALTSGAWPAASRAKVNAYIAALDSERHILTSIAAKTTLSAMQAEGGELTTALTQVQTGETGLIAEF